MDMRCIILCCTCVAVVGAVFDEEPEVSTAQGRIRGHSIRWSANESVNVFLGIPYADAPTGTLRWAPPRATRPWSPAILNATMFRPSCMQAAGQFVTNNISEDCLSLNVFAPARNGLHPVMVWIHGGSYVGGGTSQPTYNGVPLAAEEGLVVVSMNYRLGIFGFLGGEALRKRDPQGSTGNWGTLDQQLAMQWVHQHIFAFGGDSKHILVAGESSGAGSVAIHMVSPASKGLFSSASMQSTAFGDWLTAASDAHATLEKVLNATHCSDVACMQEMPADKLQQVADSFGSYGFMEPPTIDGVVIPDHPWRLVRQGKQAKVSIIAGTTAEDQPEPWVQCTNCSEQETVAFLRDMLLPALGYPADNATVNWMLDVYRPSCDGPCATTKYSPWYWAQVHMHVDVVMACPARRACQAFANQSLPAYLYQFARVPADAGPGDGAYHGAELPYVFKYRPSLTTPDDVALANVVAALWRDVAAGTVSTWPQYQSGQAGPTLRFGPSGSEVTPIVALRGPQCDRWDKLFFAQEQAGRWTSPTRDTLII